MIVRLQKYSTGISVQTLLFGRYFSVLFHRVRFPYVHFSFLPERVEVVAAAIVFGLFVAVGSFGSGAYVAYFLKCFLKCDCE